MSKGVHPRLLESEPLQRCKLNECKAACCLYGVWLDAGEAADILAHADLIQPHMPEGRRDPSDWFDDRQEEDEFLPSGQVVHSAVLPSAWHYGGSACGFLRPDYKCALQVAGQAAGLHPWRFKPFYCILHPLDLDEEGRITLDTASALLEEEGSCLRPAPKRIPLLLTFEEELRYLLGDETYRALLAERPQEE